MTENSSKVMVALSPVSTSWCRIEPPHVTLVYAGDLNDLPVTAFNDLAKGASALASLTRPIALDVTGVEVFGDEDKVDVLKLRPTPELLAMRHALSSWDVSEHDYSPHATIGPVGSRTLVPIPDRLLFDRICVWWGDETLSFWLKMSGF